MAKNILFSFALSTLFACTAVAQTESFDLSDYSLPDLKRNSLETNFNTFGNNESSNYKTEQPQDASNSQYSRINLNADITFNHYRNTSNNQRLLNIQFQNDIQLGNDKESSTEDQSEYTSKYNYNRRSHNLVADFENRMYLVSGIFVATNMSILAEGNYSSSNRKSGDENTSDEISKRTTTNQTYQLFVPLQIGTGRIEQVQDARHALYIFNALTKEGRLTKQPTHDEIIAFSQLISKEKNKRFFDARHQKIAEIEAVDSFLVANNFIDTQDARYFTTVEDFWVYGGNPVRESGTRFAFTLMPGFYSRHESHSWNYEYSYAEYNSDDSGSEVINAQLYYTGIEIRHEKPIKQTLQNSITVNAFAGTTKGEIEQSEEEPGFSTTQKFKAPNAQLQYFQSIGYYPNTRTNAHINWSGQVMKLLEGNNEDYSIAIPDGYGYQLGIGFDVSYYISPQLRLSAQAKLTYQAQDSDSNAMFFFPNSPKANNILPNSGLNSDQESFYPFYSENELSSYFSIGLTYSIF